MQQELCLVSEPGAGHIYMHLYDSAPMEVREYLREAKYNLCMACLMDMVMNYAYINYGSIYVSPNNILRNPRYFFSAIDDMERRIYHATRAEALLREPEFRDVLTSTKDIVWLRNQQW